MNRKVFGRAISAALMTVLLGASLQQAHATQATPVTVTYWDYFISQSSTVDEAIKNFEAANPDIKIKRVTQDQTQYTNLVNLAFQGDSAPDVFALPTQNIGFSQMVDQGWLAPLNGLSGYDQFKARFADSAFGEGVNVLNGKVYSVPFGKNLPWLQLWINTDMYKKAGLVNADGTVKFPKTMDDIIANARTIKTATGKYGYGFASSSVGLQYMNCMFSGPHALPDFTFWDPRTGKHTMSTVPCYRKLIDSLLTMQKEKLLLPDSLTIDDETLRVRFANGEVAQMLNGTWIIGGWAKTNPDFKGYAAGPLPLVGVDKPTSYWYVTPGGSFFAINPKTKVMDAAWKFYQYLYSETFATLWAKEGQGFALFTKDPEQYAADPGFKGQLQMAAYVMAAPYTPIRNPDATKVQITMTGKNESDILTGILTGQIKEADINAELADYDKRADAALDQAIKDAKTAGAKISLQDYIYSDWDPTKPYVTQPNAKSPAATMSATVAATAAK